MNNSAVKQAVIKDIGELFAWEDKGDFCEISTPFLDPSNDYIHLYCRFEKGELVVGDFAETTAYLEMQMTPNSLTAKHMKQIEMVCVSLDLELQEGEILGRCRSGDSLAETIIDVAQASIRVAAIWETERDA